MSNLGFGRTPKLLLYFAALAVVVPGSASAEIVTFNMADVALFSSAPPSTITATTGQQIPGGLDNSAAHNQFNLSSLQFDIDGDFDPLGPDPSIYFDLQIRTATFLGGQVVLDGFQHVFSPPGSERGGFVVIKGTNTSLNVPFLEGDVIGDGVDEFIRNGYSPDPNVPPFPNNTFSVAIDEGGPVTYYVAGVDNFLGFQLDDESFGWIRVEYNSTAPGTLTFLDGAYDNTGAPIVAGSTTEDLPGDFNHNNTVDAADYTVWRDTLGSTSDLRANGDNSGGSANVIDIADFNVWKNNFGMMRGSGGSLTTLSAAVPEPSTILLALLPLGFFAAGRLRGKLA